MCRHVDPSIIMTGTFGHSEITIATEARKSFIKQQQDIQVVCKTLRRDQHTMIPSSTTSSFELINIPITTNVN